jgi:hypothetical protein
MNKFILCAMDKRKTKEELEANYDAAFDYYSESERCEYAAYAAYDAAYAAHTSYYAAHAAYYDDFECYLNEYFKLTGENREAYQREADK